MPGQRLATRSKTGAAHPRQSDRESARTGCGLARGRTRSGSSESSGGRTSGAASGAAGWVGGWRRREVANPEPLEHGCKQGAPLCLRRADLSGPGDWRVSGAIPLHELEAHPLLQHDGGGVTLDSVSVQDQRQVLGSRASSRDKCVRHAGPHRDLAFRGSSRRASLSVSTASRERLECRGEYHHVEIVAGFANAHARIAAGLFVAHGQSGDKPQRSCDEGDVLADRHPPPQCGTQPSSLRMKSSVEMIA
eukprot:scaffold93646_cov60-Phaeocystis_antarctica.AAC.2